MVILRPTRRLTTLLPLSSPPEKPSDTALGDWYVNRLVVDKQPLLILLSSRGLLPILAPARDVRGLPRRLGSLVADRLGRLGVAEALVEPELRAMDPVLIAPTVDRSVLGVLVDFAKLIPFYLEPGTWNAKSLLEAEAKLAHTPCYASKRDEDVVWPERDAPALVMARWHAAEPAFGAAEGAPICGRRRALSLTYWPARRLPRSALTAEMRSVRQRPSCF
jgi:hypothetical protein